MLTGFKNFIMKGNVAFSRFAYRWARGVWYSRRMSILAANRSSFCRNVSSHCSSFPWCLRAQRTGGTQLAV